MLGILTTAAVTAASASTLETLAHQVIQISQDGYPKYLSVQQFRYEYAQFRYDVGLLLDMGA